MPLMMPTRGTTRMPMRPSRGPGYLTNVKGGDAGRERPREPGDRPDPIAIAPVPPAPTEAPTAPPEAPTAPPEGTWETPPEGTPSLPPSSPATPLGPGTFQLPGQGIGSAPFRTMDFWSNRFVGGPGEMDRRPEEMVGPMEGGTPPPQLDPEALRRIYGGALRGGMRGM